MPRKNARRNENVPATNPFHATMASGSLPEILRVKLLSTPHSTQARIMPSAPSESPNPLEKLAERKYCYDEMKKHFFVNLQLRKKKNKKKMN